MSGWDQYPLQGPGAQNYKNFTPPPNTPSDLTAGPPGGIAVTVAPQNFDAPVPAGLPTMSPQFVFGTTMAPSNAGHIVPPPRASFGEPAPGQPHGPIPPGYKPSSATAGAEFGGQGSSIEDYIRQGAIARGLNPDEAVHTAMTEGGVGRFRLGDSGKSGGPFQLYTGGGLGNEFEAKTGLSPLDSNNEKATIDFALDYAKEHGGFSPNIWHGLRRPQYPIVSTEGWKVDPDAVTTAASQPDTSVVWMEPTDYKAMVLAAGAPDKTDSKSLNASLKRGEAVETLPDLTVKQEGNRLVVTDQDGLRRAQEAERAGVQLMPVAIHGAQGFTGNEIQGIGGQRLPYDFKSVDVPKPHPGILGQFGEGVRTTIGGATQTVEHILPSGLTGAIDKLNNTLVEAGVPLAKVPEGGIDTMERQRQEELINERGPNPTIPEIAGEIAAILPLSRVIPGIGGNALARIGSAAIGGGLGALAEPVTGNDFWREKAKQVGVGMALGGGLGVAGEGIARGIAPAILPAAQRLMDQGVRLTPGMMLGGITKGTENRLSSVVPTISGAVKRAIDDFNIAAYNKVLGRIGQKYTGKEVGYDGIKQVEKQISDAYNRLLPQIQFRVDTAFVNDITNLRTLASYMPRDDARRFTAIFNNEFMGRIDSRGTMDGKTLKMVESELSRLSGQFSRSESTGDRQLGNAVGEINAAIRDNLERQNPKHADQLRRLNGAWAAFVRIRDAAANRSRSGGVFTPGDLLTASKRAAGKRVFARGDALMQDLARDAQEIIPNTYPESGTAGRLTAGLLLGEGAHLLHPGALATVIGANAAYTRPGVAGLRFLAGAGLPQTRNLLSRAVRQGVNALAPGGGAVVSRQPITISAPQSFNPPTQP